MSKVALPLSSCHMFLLELQAVSPRHCVVVHMKWHFIEFVDATQIFVDFSHVSSKVQAWQLQSTVALCHIYLYFFRQPLFNLMILLNDAGQAWKT